MSLLLATIWLLVAAGLITISIVLLSGLENDDDGNTDDLDDTTQNLNTLNIISPGGGS